MHFTNTAQEPFEPFEWLLSRIDKVDLQANGTCHPSLRRLVIKVLERCLIDADWLTVYSWGLKRILGDTPRYERVLEGKSLKELSEGGLGTLDNQELIHLALDPVTLWALFYRIKRYARFKEFRYWMELVEKVKVANPDARMGPDAPLPYWDRGSEDVRVGAPATSHPSVQPKYGFALAAQRATAERPSQNETTTRLSRYKLMDETGAEFCLETDREGHVFVVLPAHMLNIAPKGLVINGEPCTLNWEHERSFEIENFGKGDLRDLSDADFTVKGIWKW